ncbi:hypothetical protein RB195_016526 [Necator americanus]|uniref:Uncharacterized protein n=1 Tax=Necator americanus TaxID=51031 RepID=A0ABR1C393_NECAM
MSTKSLSSSTKEAKVVDNHLIALDIYMGTVFHGESKSVLDVDIFSPRFFFLRFFFFYQNHHRFQPDSRG